MSKRTSLSRMGRVLSRCDRWEEALASFDRSQEAFLDVMANLYLSRAELMLELGDTSMSAACCARALDIYRETDHRL